MTSSNRSAPTSSNRPLSERTVVVTRPRAQAGSLIAALEKRGARVLHVPAFRIAAIENPRLAAALTGLSAAGADTGVVFTSGNAVEHFARACDQAGISPSDMGDAFVACVGPATAEALSAIGVSPHLTAAVHTAAGLVAEVTAARSGKTSGLKTVLFPCARDAGDTLETGLGALGISVDRFEIYGAVAEDAAPPFQSIPDVVTFASPSAASMFEQIIDAETAERIKRESLAACIGPSTAERVTELHYDRVRVASQHTVDGIVDTLIAHYS